MRQLFPFALNNKKIVSVFDLPIPKNGVGVFTTLKVAQTVPLFLEHHIERLTLHARKQGITIDLSNIAENIQRLLLENSATDAAIRVSVRSGNCVLIHATTLPKSENVSAITYKTQEKLPIIKQIDRNIYQTAQQEAQKQGAMSALFVDNGFFVESIMSNIVSLDEAGNLITPSLNNQGLKGITRQILLDKGILEEKEIPVITNMPLVLINSLRVQAVTLLDGVSLPDSSTLLIEVQKYIEQEEKAYKDSYYR